MQEIGLVLDTNVVVSAHLRSSGLERFVFDLALSSRGRLYVSSEIMQEYRDVLMRPKFGLTPERLAESLKVVQEAAIRVTPVSTVYAATDLDDNKFLECAEAARADYLVTGNGRHFPRRWKSTKIVSSRELATILIPEL